MAATYLTLRLATYLAASDVSASSLPSMVACTGVMPCLLQNFVHCSIACSLEKASLTCSRLPREAMTWRTGSRNSRVLASPIWSAMSMTVILRPVSEIDPLAALCTGTTARSALRLRTASRHF